MSDFTPTTDQVRDCYVFGGDPDQGDEPDRGADFDRWLAATLATVRPNPDDARQVEVAKRAASDAIPLGLTMNPDWNEAICESIARAVLAAQAEAVK